MDRALYVGVKPDNYNYLLHRGYVRALERCGWKTTWLSHAEARASDISQFDLILWDSVIGERQLKTVRNGQKLVLLGGVGDNLGHYSKYAEKIALATSSHYYIDQPVTNITRHHIGRAGILSRQAYYILLYSRRFSKQASPRFWRRLGIKFLYLPFASDPELFFPRSSSKDLRWVFCGDLRGRPFIRNLMELSGSKNWAYRVYSPQIGTAVDPLKLNDIYNSSEIGVNEQHLMTFGRELNQRNFDLGMAGLHQITDLEYLAKPMFECHCTCYAGKLADREDRIFGLSLVEQAISSNREETHAFFRKWHSFERRLRSLSDILGEDLTRGKCVS